MVLSRILAEFFFPTFLELKIDFSFQLKEYNMILDFHSHPEL